MTKKPNKSRKQFVTKQKHAKSKGVATHLDKKLKEEIGKRSVPVRTKDTVKIERGEFKGKTGQITKVDRNTGKIFIEGIKRKKSDGTEYQVGIDPSNVIIITLEKSDKKRFKNKVVKK